MDERDKDSRKPIDVLVSSPGREGLTGTAPADLYSPAIESEQVTTAPDQRPMEEQPAWRQDFPIDSPQDDYVARRDFMKFMVLTSLAFTVGQFWIGVQNWWRRRRGQAEIKRIASVSQIPVGGALPFVYPGDQDVCLIIRPESDVLVAYSQQCTHLACAVLPRVRENHLHCPCHEGLFDLVSGRPIAGPPRRPLPRIVLEIRGDEIYATGVELRSS